MIEKFLSVQDTLVLLGFFGGGIKIFQFSVEGKIPSYVFVIYCFVFGISAFAVMTGKISFKNVVFEKKK